MARAEARSINAAVLLTGSEGGGVGRFLQTQYEHAADYGLRMTYFHMEDGPVIGALRSMGAPLVQLPCRAWKMNPGQLEASYGRWITSRDGLRNVARVAADAFAQAGSELIYAQSLPGHIAAGLAARRLRRPAVGHYHGVLSRARAYGLSRLGLSWVLWSMLDRVFAVSEFARATFAWPVAGRVRRVYNGTDCAAVAAAARGVTKSAGLCVCVGRLVPAKRLDVAIRAMALLRSRGVAGRLELIGGPVDESNTCYQALRALVGELGLGDRVSFVGVLSPPFARMAEADAFVHCCGYESFGLAAVEAMACGTAVVGPDAGGSAEVVEHERSGLTYATGDPTALADALERVLRDGVLRTRLAEAGRSRATEQFGIAAHMRAMRAAFDEVLADRVRGAV